MDYILKTDTRVSSHTSKNDKVFSVLNSINEIRKVQYMWSHHFTYFTPFEKLFVVLIFSQILKNVNDIINIEFPSISNLFPFFQNIDKFKQKRYEKQYFFIKSQDSKSILVVQKTLLDLQNSIKQKH